MNAQDYASNGDSIFVLPDAVLKVKQLIDDDASSMFEIADVINYDPAIMAQVLRMSNSALYKFPNKITTVSKAIQVIGTSAVYDLVLAYGVSNAFKDVEANVIDLHRFWANSVGCGLLAKRIGEELLLKEPERLFVCGLLHNIGELVVVKLNPSVAKQCAEISATATPLQLQMQYLGFSYAEIGAKLLQLWGLPAEISHPIAQQHKGFSEAGSPNGRVQQLCTILALNNVYKDHYGAYDNVSVDMYESLGLNLRSVGEAIESSHLQLTSTMALFKS
jgi:HD-like signal output (HDOD) protein